MLLPAGHAYATKKHGSKRKLKIESTRPPLLTVYIFRDDGRFMAKCPELDLVTEMNTPEKAFDDLLDLMREYAKDYRQRLDWFSRSPNRAHHKPYIEVIAACKTKWELLELISVKYGHLHLRSVA